jgi:hypothetical protein
MAKSAFAIDSPATLILVGAGVVALGTYLIKKRNAGPKEIASSAIPPAYLPGGGIGAAPPQLGASSNLGIVDLKVLFDPKIIVLRPGGRVSLRATRWRELVAGGGGATKVRLEGTWLAPHADEYYEGRHHEEPFLPMRGVGLYNVGGPGASRLRRWVNPATVVDAEGYYSQNCGIQQTCNLIVVAPNDWTSNDWAQIRLYPADVTLTPDPPNNQVETVRIRTDMQPVQTVWIMGAYS